MSAGLYRRRSNGVYTRQADGTYGRVTPTADCGCCCPTGPCEFCADSVMPLYYRLSTSGIAYSDNGGVPIDLPNGTSFQYDLDATPSLAGPLCLAPVLDCLRSVADFGLTGTNTLYSGAGGSGGISISPATSSSLDWFLRKSANLWQLFAWLDGDISEPTNTRHAAFYGENAVTDPVNCNTTLNFTNLLTNTATPQAIPLAAFGFEYAIAMAYGGTATVVACGCGEEGI